MLNVQYVHVQRVLYDTSDFVVATRTVKKKKERSWRSSQVIVPFALR